MPKKVINSFNSGELSPYVYARSDIDKYGSGCLVMENVTPLPYGGATRRPAIELIGKTKSDDQVRLIPFKASVDASYILELGTEYVRFWKNGDRINEETVDVVEAATYKWTASASGTGEYYLEALAGGDPAIDDPDYISEDGVEMDGGALGSLLPSTWAYGDNDTLGYSTIYARISGGADPDTKADGYLVAEYALERGTPYTDTELNSIKYVQSIDVLWFTYASDEVLRVSRTSDTEWAVEDEVFDFPPLREENDTPITMSPSDTEGTITLESSTDFFDANHVGAYFSFSTTRTLENQSASDSLSTTGFVPDIATSPNGILVSSSDWEVATSGTWRGRLVLQRSIDGGTLWEDYIIIGDTLSAGAGGERNFSLSSDEPEAINARLRLRYTQGATTPGTITAELRITEIDVTSLVKIISYTSATSVEAEVKNDFQDVPSDYAAHVATTSYSSGDKVAISGGIELDSTTDISAQIGTNPRGMTFDGTYYWVVCTTGQNVYKLDNSFTQVATWSASAQFASLADIAYYAGEVYIAGKSSGHYDVVKVFSTTGVYSRQVSSDGGNLRNLDGLEYYNGSFYYGWNFPSSVYTLIEKRNPSSFAVTKSSNVGSQERLAVDFAGKDGMLYTLDYENLQVDRYTEGLVNSFESDISTITDPQGIVWDGLFLYILNNAGVLYKYEVVESNLYYEYVHTAANTGAFKAQYDAGYWAERTPEMTTWSEGAFSDYRGHPQAIALFENRLCYAGTASDPDSLWMSVIDDYSNFRTGSIDIDGLKLGLSSGQLDEIRWMVPQSHLTIGTASGEWSLGASDESKPVTPTAFSLKRKTTYGSNDVQAVLVNSAVLFLMRQSRKVREWTFQYENQDYVAPDLSILAEHITESGIVQWDFQQQPDNVLWGIRGDGQMVGLTYERDQNVVGWHRHTLEGGAGSFESVAIIPRSGEEDEVYVSCKIVVDGVTKRYIGRLNDREWGDDYTTEWEGSDFYKTYASPASTTLTGLDYLEGKAVDVVADGAIKDSETVSGGAITIDAATYTKVVVGLPMTSTVAPVYLDAQNQYGTTMGSKKDVRKAIIRFKDTFSAQVGQTLTSLEDVRFDEDLTPLYNGDSEVRFDNESEFLQTCYIVQSDPMPCTVLALIPIIEGKR